MNRVVGHKQRINNNKLPEQLISMSYAEDIIADLPKKATRKLNHIPGDRGRPLIGYTLEFFNDLPALIQQLSSKHGNVFKRGDLFQITIDLIGADANEFVLKDTERNFSNKRAWEVILEELFPNGLMLRDFDNHRYHRRILQEAFKKPVLEAYTSNMNRVFDDGLSRWPTEQPFCFFNSIKSLLLDTATEIFLGEDLGPEASKVNRAFVDVVEASLAIFRVPIPGTHWYRGLKGRRFLEKFFFERIADKRQIEGDDFFSKICHAIDEDGNRLTDKEIVDHMIFLLFAAHDTTTSTLSSIIYELTRHPQWQNALREEMLALNKRDLEYDDLPLLEKTGWVFHEALRMHPPLPVIPRRAVRECEFKGYRIPKNAGVMIHPLHTHFMPEYWHEPQRFDPQRWSPQRNEAKQNFWQFLPFGGGAHKCLGLNFAQIQSKLFLFKLLTRYRFEIKAGHQMVYNLVPLAVPKNGLPIVLHRL